ncbi:hypothetical protein [Catenulispora sp. GAS73]|uniref:hypothetical protein n=1 Tax=Catenulispora sp. GAS73 TaxID=3156269 RepID=UPI003511A14B
MVLPTGDQVTVTGAGSQARYAVRPTLGASTAFATLDDGVGDHYTIPAEVVPYAGRVLDLSLFNVSKLATTAPQANSRIPVRMAFAAGVTPSAPPGVALTSVSGSAATGYLDPASGAAFAAALRKQIGADVAAGRKAGSGALFGGMTAMAPLDTPLPAATPHYPLHILQLNAIDDTGAPDSFGAILLVNTDSAKIFHAVTFPVDGLARLAVPAGNYAAYLLDFSFDAQGNATKSQNVAVNDFSVSGTAGAAAAVTLDARTAIALLTVATQQPATEDGAQVSLVRQGTVGPAATWGVIDTTGTLANYVNPSPRARIGRFDENVQWYGAGPASASPYRYDLSFDSDQILADQSHSVSDRRLATNHLDLADDPSFGTRPLYLYKGAVPPLGLGTDTLPSRESLGSMTEYATPGDPWIYGYLSPANGPTSAELLESDAVTYVAGQVTARDWAKGPLTARVGQHPADVFDIYGCQGCVGGGNLGLSFSPIGDSSPDTTVFQVGADPSNIAVFWDGQQIVAGPGTGVVVTGVPASPAEVRAVLDVDRTALGVSQSTKTHTDVTFPYSGKADVGSTLPSGVTCLAAITPPTTGPCQILPVLTVNYHLVAVDNLNTSHTPIQALLLDVGHLSYGNQGSKAAVTSAQVSVSFDSGVTWQNVPSLGANGHYVALWQNPAPPTGAHPMLRVTATDALGGTITQTTTNAYTVAPR